MRCQTRYIKINSLDKSS